MKAVSYIDRDEFLAEARQYVESLGKEFDDKLREMALAVYAATESAYRRGYTDGINTILH